MFKKDMQAMQQKRQAGFGIIEIMLLILLLLLLLLLLWYFFWGKGSNQPAAPAAENSAPQVSQKKDPTEGWKEYCSVLEKSCFKYPADWTFKKDPNSTLNEEFMQAISPSGTTVNWNPDVTGVGGSCDVATDPIIFIKSAKAVPTVANLYAVGTGPGAASSTHAMGLDNGANNQPPQLGSTGDCLYIHLFKSKDGSRQMWLSSGSVNAQDLATVELMLTTYHY